MSEYMNNLPDPEEFWPEAEKMLNGHFQAKRRRRAALWLAAVLLVISTVFVLTHEEENVSADNSSAAPEQMISSENTVAPPASPEANSSPSSANRENNTTTPPSQKTKVTPASAEKTNGDGIASNEAEKKQQPVNIVQRTVAGTSGVKLPVAIKATQPAKETEPSSPVLNPVAGNPLSQQNPTIEKPEVNLSSIAFLPAKSIMMQQEAHPAISGKQEVKPLPKLKSRYDFIAYAGMNYVDKVINSPGNTIYMQRREAEESATFLPYLGAQIAKSVSKFEIRAGAEFSVLGERVNYSPYKNGEYYNSYLDWDPYSYTVTDTDSAWIFGMLFLQTNSYQVNDSIEVTVTDTLNGRHYDASILSANGTNRWYLIQFPIEFSYSVMRGRFGIGISGGIAPGLVVGSTGKYLLKDESGVREISRAGSGNFMLSAGGGIEFSYQLGDKCSVLLRPNARYFITPVEEENGASKNYRTIGIHAGLRYRIR